MGTVPASGQRDIPIHMYEGTVYEIPVKQVCGMMVIV